MGVAARVFAPQRRRAHTRTPTVYRIRAPLLSNSCAAHLHQRKRTRRCPFTTTTPTATTAAAAAAAATSHAAQPRVAVGMIATAAESRTRCERANLHACRRADLALPRSARARERERKSEKRVPSF